MLKNKRILLMLIAIAILFLLPSICNASNSVTLTKHVYANDGSAKYVFSGLTLETTHEYQFGISKTAATAVKKWYLITEYTQNTVTIDTAIAKTDFIDVTLAVDTGYITIKDKTTDTIILSPYAIDLKIPYLKISNYSVLNNGKDLDSSSNNIKISNWNAGNSKAFYQYEKITDEAVINKYKAIKKNNGDYNDLQSILKTTPPTSNWNTWGYWNGHGSYTNGFGYTQRQVKAPDYGLYYMWIYLSGTNVKNTYGYILVDNLQPEIALDSISLPETAEVELGATLTLKPGFSPNNTTNKIVTWNSSDESIATVDNNGKITPIKVGSVLITVTSQDGNKKATCTVTVVNSNDNKPGTEDTTKYLSFPFIIFNGKSSITVKNYNGSYQLYYQFVEVTDEQYSQLIALKEKYQNSEITYAEFLTRYKQILPQYNDANWVETTDGKFEKDLSEFTGTKKFALWGKLVMDTKTVYEAEVYTMDGSGKSTNVSDEIDKTTDKDDDTTIKNDSKLPQTGIAFMSIIGIAILVVAIISKVKYGKYKDIK